MNVPGPSSLGMKTPRVMVPGANGHVGGQSDDGPERRGGDEPVVGTRNGHVGGELDHVFEVVPVEWKAAITA